MDRVVGKTVFQSTLNGTYELCFHIFLVMFVNIFMLVWKIEPVVLD